MLNRRFVGVRDLISQESCDSPRLRHLEEGLAKAANVSLPAAAPASAALGDDWRGFVMDCAHASFPEVTNNMAGAAIMCNFAEAALAEIGNPDWYASFRSGGLASAKGWSQDSQDLINSTFDAFWKAGEGPIHDRGQKLVPNAGF